MYAPSSLDTLPTALSPADTSSAPPPKASYSTLKSCALSSAALVFLHAALSLILVCEWRSFCAAGIGAGSSIRYDATVSAAFVPAALALALVVAPVAAAAGRCARPAVSLLGFSLASLATALLVIFTVATFAVLGAAGTLDDRAAAAWAALPQVTKAKFYGGSQAALAAEMKADAVAISVVALVGAVVVGVLTVSLLPHARAALTSASPSLCAAVASLFFRRPEPAPAAFDGVSVGRCFAVDDALVELDVGTTGAPRDGGHLLSAARTVAACCSSTALAPAAAIGAIPTSSATRGVLGALLWIPCCGGTLAAVAEFCFRGQRRGRLPALTGGPAGAAAAPSLRTPEGEEVGAPAAATVEDGRVVNSRRLGRR